MTRTTSGSLVAPRRHAFVDSPVGPLALIATGGALSGLFMADQRRRPPASALGDLDPRHRPPSAALGELDPRHRPPAAALGEGEPPPFPAVIDQLGAYFAGERTDFDLPLATVGTPFQRAVWAALRRIPYGETVSYGQIARHIGRPGASRAVGLANATNPIGIIVPCHRVVGANGSLTGYGGGLERKRSLLELEQRLTTPRLPGLSSGV